MVNSQLRYFPRYKSVKQASAEVVRCYLSPPVTLWLNAAADRYSCCFIPLFLCTGLLLSELNNNSRINFYSSVSKPLFSFSVFPEGSLVSFTVQYSEFRKFSNSFILLRPFAKPALVLLDPIPSSLYYQNPIMTKKIRAVSPTLEIQLMLLPTSLDHL